MSTQAEYVAAIGVDLTKLDQGIASARAKLAGLGTGVPTTGVDSFVAKAVASFNSLGQSLTKVGTTLSIGVTAPLLLIGKAAFSAGSSFESAFAGVRKTVDASEADLSRLRDGFRKLAIEIPISANEMAKIGEAAGALGVKTQDILGFTKVMADLGVATNLTSDQAANGLARLANIIKNEAGPQYDRLGSTLVALGNAGASTESEILEMSLRIAGAGKQAGLSEADILGFANALSSVGIEAEAGGSAISKVFTKIDDAAKLGGKSLTIFAAVAGQSVASYKQSIETDAAGATISFIEGLGKISASGKSLTPVLDSLGLADIRVADALKRASGAGDLFRESLALGSKAWAENTALTKEAAERYKTFESQVQIIQNRLTDIAITIFDKLRPALVGMLDAIKGAISGFVDLDVNTIKAGATFLAVAGSAGPIALMVGKLLSLGPGGAAVAAVVAGSAAMAAAYVTDFATINQTINNHVALFTKGTNTIIASGTSMMDKFELWTIGLLNFSDHVVAGLEGIAVEVVRVAKIMFASLTGNWSGVIAAWEEGNAKLDAIDAVMEANSTARMHRINQIHGEAAWRDLWAKSAAASRSGAQLTTEAIDEALGTGLSKVKAKVILTSKEIGEQAASITASAYRNSNENWKGTYEKTLAHLLELAKNEALVVAASTGKGAAEATAKNYREIIQGQNPVQSLIDILKKGQGPVRAEGSKLGSVLGNAMKLGHDSEVYKSPYFALDALSKALDGIGTVAKGGKKHGVTLGKALLDGFKEGIAGLDQAMEFLTNKASTTGFGSLFERIGKAAKAGAEVAVSALKIASDAINEFLSAQGINAKFGPEDLAKRWDISKPLRESAVAFGHLKDAIAQINIDRVVQGFSALDDTIVLDGKTVKLATLTYDELRAKFPAVADSLKELGFVFQNVWPGMTTNIKQFAAELDRVSDDIVDFFQGPTDASQNWAAVLNDMSSNVSKSLERNAVGTKAWGDQVTAEFEKVSEAAPHWAGAIVDTAAKVKKAMEDSAEIIRAKAEIEIHDSMQSVVDTFIKLGQQSKLTGDALIDFVQNKISKLGPALRDGAQKALQDFIKEMYKLPGALNEVFDKLNLGAKKQVSGLFDIIGAIPGKFGDALRKSTSEITKWIDQIDGILKGLHKIFASIPDGLADALGKVTGIVKSTKPILDGFGSDWLKVGQIGKTSASTVASSWSKASDGMKVTLGAAAGAFATLTASMAVTSATGSKTAGFLTSLFGSTMAGIQAGLAFGPVGGAIVGGVSLIGGIIGMFMGKSSAQKEQERIAAEKVKVDMQQAAQNVVKSAIEGFQKGLEFLNQLDEFTRVRKEKFRAFFAQFSKLMDYFIELAKKWSGDSLAKAKIAAESIGPIADAISRLPDAFTAINGHFSTAQSAIDSFFLDFDKVMTAFFARSEVWIEGISKRAMKVADRLTPVVSLISGFAAAVLDIGKVVEPDESIWGIFDRTIENIVSHVAALAEKFDKAVLKVMANFSDKAGSALTLWKDAVDAIKGMTDIPMPTDADFANVFNGIEKVISGMNALADRLSTEGLAKAQALATASLTIFASIKAGVEAMAALKDFKDVLPEIFGAFYDDFNAAVDMLTQMANRAIQFDAVSKTLDQYISSGAATLTHAFTMLSQIMNAAGAFFPGGSPDVVSQSAAAPLGAAAAGSLAPLSAGTFGSSSAFAAPQGSQSSGVTVQVIINVPGGVIMDQVKYQEITLRAMQGLVRSGRLPRATVG